MAAFTEAELEYLASQRLGRLATASSKGVPEVSPVGFRADADGISSGGLDITKTVRFRNIQATGLAAIVVDDLASVDPWRPRGVKVRGRAEIIENADGSASIRITPHTVWSWGINEGAETYFAGRIEKRTISSRPSV
jgi:pyridoxamine 5'-phosphate oxidase family protein